MTESSFPILTCCLLWPLLGAVMVMTLKKPGAVRWLALAIGMIELGLTLIALSQFDASNSQLQLLEDHSWIPSINARYQLGVDGISILFLPMSALLCLMSLLAGWNSVQRLQRFHLALLLLLQSVTIGVFCAVDLVLFFLFWELTLPPLFFLIGLWGVGANRRQAALKYVLYLLFGGVSLLLGMIALAIQQAGLQDAGSTLSLSFSLPTLLTLPFSADAQTLIFLLLLLGFAVKTPLVPLHGWLPTTAMEGPPQVTALLLGLKLGVYGLIRFALPLAPDAAQHHRWLLAILGSITLIYGALLALQQSNLRRLLAYAGISHVGLVVMGIASFTLQGLQGAMMQLLNFGLVAGSLMLMAGMVQQRLGSNELLHLGGLAKPMPRLTTLFFVFALSSIGLPGLNGFPAELLMIWGTFDAYPSLGGVALFAAVLGAAYILQFSRHAFLGPVHSVAVAQAQDLRPREWAMLIVPALWVLWLGFHPQTVLSLQTATLKDWLQHQQSEAGSRLPPQQSSLLASSSL